MKFPSLDVPPDSDTHDALNEICGRNKCGLPLLAAGQWSSMAAPPKLALAASCRLIYFGTKKEHVEEAMRKTGKLDYLELPAKGGSYDSTKLFYARAFGWTFTDYGATYCAFDEGLEGGFQGDETEARTVPLPVLYSENLEESLAAVRNADGEITREIFQFPGGRRFHFRDPAGNEMAVWGS